jgi:transposase
VNRAKRRWPLQPDRPRHELDDDACCIYCGFDAAEEYHLRVTSVEPEWRKPAPDWAIYCKKAPRADA